MLHCIVKIPKWRSIAVIVIGWAMDGRIECAYSIAVASSHAHRRFRHPFRHPFPARAHVVAAVIAIILSPLLQAD